MLAAPVLAVVVAEAAVVVVVAAAVVIVVAGASAACGRNGDFAMCCSCVRRRRQLWEQLRRLAVVSCHGKAAEAATLKEVRLNQGRCLRLCLFCTRGMLGMHKAPRIASQG